MTITQRSRLTNIKIKVTSGEREVERGQEGQRSERYKLLSIKCHKEIWYNMRVRVDLFIITVSGV